MQEDLKELQEDLKELQEDPKELQEDPKELQEDQGSLQEDQGSLQEDHNKFLKSGGVLSFVMQESILIFVSQAFARDPSQGGHFSPIFGRSRTTLPHEKVDALSLSALLEMFKK